MVLKIWDNSFVSSAEHELQIGPLTYRSVITEFFKCQTLSSCSPAQDEGCRSSISLDVQIVVLDQYISSLYVLV